jgi:hypothetical protein
MSDALGHATITPPAECPHCGGRDCVKLETIVKGHEVQLLWRCGSCDHGWAVAADATLSLVQPVRPPLVESVKGPGNN